jgi:hypothetical protein
MSKFIDLIGKQFGKLTVVRREENKQKGVSQWFCTCSCGGTKVVAGGNLRSSSIKTCGCFDKERIRKKVLENGDVLYRCCTCKVFKEAKEYGNVSSSKYGIGNSCLICSREHSKIQNDKSKDYRKEKRDSLTLEEKEEIASKNLLRRIGITLNQKREKFLEQDQKCEICGSMSHKNHKKGFEGENGWFADHDHFTGKFRGVLCVNCNMALGQVNDDTGILKSMISYLEKYKQKEV